MSASREETRRQFGRMAKEYANSEGHAKGADLGRLVELFAPAPDWRVLDVATGAGHTAVAVAPLVRHVTAIDLAVEMIKETELLAKARGVQNVAAEVMDTEALSFPDHSFDGVTCRIAPHHFLDIDNAFSEIARVTKLGGRLALEDSCSPSDSELDAFLNRLERLRDPTHIRSYTQAEWMRILEHAGFEVEHQELYRKTHSLHDWLVRAGVSDEVSREVHQAILAAPAKAREYFALSMEDVQTASFSDDKILIVANRV